VSGRSGGFASSLFFAVIAALATVPFVMVAGPVVGPRFIVMLGCVSLGAGYLFAVAPSWSRGVRIASVALGLGIVVAVVAPSQGAAALGAASILGILRSGFLYRSRPARALVIETGLLSLGLLLAGVLAGSAALSYPSLGLRFGLGVWGFFLVQSLFFVVGGVSTRAEEQDGVDPFVKAREEALRIMEDLTA